MKKQAQKIIIRGLFLTFFVSLFLTVLVTPANALVAEPVATKVPVLSATPPAGCTYKQVQCVQAPCEPVLDCPNITKAPATTVTITTGPTSTTPSGSCIYKKYGDADCNSVLDSADYVIWKNAYTTPDSKLLADFNDDKKVSLIDLEIWIRNTIKGLPITPSVQPKPDLKVEEINRDATYYTAKICNRGTGVGTAKFLVKATNAATGKSFVSNAAYPYDVPAVGQCVTTGGITCNLVDSNCTDSVNITMEVDPDNRVPETDDSNNSLAKSFTLSPTPTPLRPNLVVEDVLRDTTYYTVKVCNRGQAAGTGSFLFKTTNVGTGQSYVSNAAYPYNIPAVNSCITTGGVTCSLIGGTCTTATNVKIDVDPDNRVVEANETDNSFTKAFTAAAATATPVPAGNEVWKQAFVNAEGANMSSATTSQVTIKYSTPTQWNNGCMGCGGSMCTSVMTSGYVVLMSAPTTTAGQCIFRLMHFRTLTSTSACTPTSGRTVTSCTANPFPPSTGGSALQ